MIATLVVAGAGVAAIAGVGFAVLAGVGIPRLAAMAALVVVVVV